MANGAASSPPDIIDVSEVDSTPLDDDDLFDVQNELTPVAAKWRSIGIALRLKPDVLDGIKAENSGDPPACLTSTVTEWLKRNYNVTKFGEPTWQKLVEVVGHPNGGANMALARDMAKKYKAGDVQLSSDTVPPHAPDSKSPIEQDNGSSSALAVAGDQPLTTTAEDEIKKLIIKNRPLVFVTAGKSGAGKSTLINNLLGLRGKKAAESRASRKSVTKAVDYYEEEVHGIKVRIIDTPGLEAKDRTSKDEEETLADLSVLTDGNADIMLYCMKLSDRDDEKDERIVQKLTNAFGKDIWKHTVLVLTYGDAVLNQDEGDQETLEEFANEFEEVLKKAHVNDVPVKSILSAQDAGSESESVQQPEIIGVPVGKHTTNPQDWRDLLFKEIIKKCKIDSIPAMLVLQGMTPGWIEAVLVLGGIVGAGAGWLGGGAAGGTAGASIGSVVGGTIGAAFGGIGSIPGAAIGAGIGEFIGVLTGAVAVGGAGVMAAGGTVYGAARLSDKWFSYAAIIRARKRVEELEKKKENEKEEMKATEEKKASEVK